MSQTELSQTAQSSQSQPEDRGVPIQIEEGYAYFEGRIVPISQAKISIATHAIPVWHSLLRRYPRLLNEEQQQLYVLKLREHF